MSTLVVTLLSILPMQQPPTPTVVWNRVANTTGVASGLWVQGSLAYYSDLTAMRLKRLDLKTNKITPVSESVGMLPSGVAQIGDIIYVAERRGRIIRRLRVGRRALSPLPYYERWAQGMASDGTNLYVVDGRREKIHIIDPDDGTTVRSIATPEKGIWSVAWGKGALYAASYTTKSVYEMDPQTGWVVRSFPGPKGHVTALAYHKGALYAVCGDSGRLYRHALNPDITVIEDMERRVNVSYEVRYMAAGEGSIENMEVFLAIPGEMVGQRLLSEITFTSAPEKIITDRWGQKVARFRVPSLKNGGRFRVGWSGKFSLYRVRFQLRRDIKTATGNAEYLADDKKYDLGSVAVTTLRRRLAKGSYYEKVRSIYDHLTHIIRYDRSGGWNNAARVLDRGTGSCSEYTFALVALLRSAGVPARYVGAISRRGDSWSFDDVYHRWAEVWFPGYGWVPVDANAGRGQGPAGRGFYLGGRSNRHVVTTVGGGSSKLLAWTYNHHQTYESVGATRLVERSFAIMNELAGDGAPVAFVTVQKSVPTLPSRLKGLSTNPPVRRAMGSGGAGQKETTAQPPVQGKQPGLLLYLIWGALMMLGGVAIGVVWASKRRRTSM